MQEEWDFLHVRKPDYNRDEMINFLELIPQYHHKIVLHDHYELILEFDLAGINLNKRNMTDLSYGDELTSACDMRSLCVKDGWIEIQGVRPDLISYSAHEYHEIEHLPFKTDYVFFSPVFDSISKQGYKSTINDPEILRAFLANTDRKIIALGGVNNQRIDLCEKWGFDGYAMLGAIWEKYFTFVETIQ